MYLSSDGTYLIGLWFEGSKNAQKHENSYITKELPIFDETKNVFSSSRYAVGWNPSCLIIHCHRVIGSNNSLTGYGGGLNNKENLLRLEKSKFKNN